MSNNNSPKLVPRKYLFTFILVTSLFALWGFANDITNPMVAAFQTVMELSAAKASMVQFAFYGGYAHIRQWLFPRHSLFADIVIKRVSCSVWLSTQLEHSSSFLPLRIRNSRSFVCRFTS